MASVDPTPTERRLGATDGYAGELRAAAEAALVCSADARRFVNECEPIINRFYLALQHVKQQRYADEQQIVDSLEDRELLVHFFIDCVRNRFLLRSKVRHIKRLLTESSPLWKRAFHDHVRSCCTCRTVDLEGGDTAPIGVATEASPVPRARLPIPFCLEVLAFIAALFPLLSWWLAHGSCALQWLFVILGVLAVLPIAALQIAWCWRRQWLLHQFAPGTFVVGMRHRKLSCLWAPSKLHLHDAAASEAVDRSFHSFGWWSRRRLFPVVATLRADGAGALAVDCPTRGWSISAAAAANTGAVQGLPRRASFDGTCIVLAPEPGGAEPEVWAKSGFWRLDILQKMLFLLAALGLMALVAAIALPPGFDIHCAAGPSLHRLPLRAFFLLDASGSIDTQAWEAEKQAAEGIVTAFRDVYATESSQELYFGVAQFATRPHLEIPLTGDVSDLVKRLRAIEQLPGGTRFKEALQVCLAQLAGPVGHVARSFDVCVLITDGASQDPPGSLAGLLPADTALFGIYVGSAAQAAEALRQLSTCGAADHSPGCHFFAKAADFAALQQQARAVAEAVAKGSDAAGGTVVGRQLPAWLPLLLPLVLPCVAWWLYLLLPRHRPGSCEAVPAGRAREIREPLRLRAAGMNESRGLAATGGVEAAGRPH